MKIDDIKRKFSLKEYVSKFTDVHGDSACCPFPMHADKTPSFKISVGPDGIEMFYCFGCAEGGTIFDFVMRMNDVDFSEALKILETEFGVTVDKINVSELELLYTTLGMFENAYASQVNTVMPYLKARGLTEETAYDYMLGYAPGILKTDRQTEDCAVTLGLQRTSFFGSSEAVLQNRLIIPIKYRGKTVAFAGRAMQGEDPKYQNTKTSLVYEKRKILFNYDRAKKAIREQKSAIIVEGYFDAILLAQYGYKNVVAPCGTAFTAEHANLLRGIGKAYLLFDPDSGGARGVEKAARELLNASVRVYVCTLPDAKDPDEFVIGGGNLQNILDTALPYPDYLKASHAGDVGMLLSGFQGLPVFELEKEVRKLSDQLSIPAAVLFNQLDRINSKIPIKKAFSF